MLNKILIIEDEKSLLDALTLNLQLENYEVFGLNNGKDALNQINIIKPDLILLDIMLPNVSGIDIFKEMLDLNINIPTIFLTAKKDIKDKVSHLEVNNIN